MTSTQVGSYVSYYYDTAQRVRSRSVGGELANLAT
eukprot:SAG11_NODE_9772_length_881_cov_2.739130_1_plen_34_part_10